MEANLCLLSFICMFISIVHRTVPPVTGPWNRDQGFLGIPPSMIAGLGAIISQITLN